MLNEKFLRNMHVCVVPMVMVMPTLAADTVRVINHADDFDRKDFWERVYFCATPAVIIVAALLGLYL